MSSNKFNIQDYLDQFKQEFLEKLEPLRKKIENNIKNLVNNYSDDQIITLIKECKLNKEQKEKLIKSFNNKTLIFIDWTILARLTLMDQNKDNPPSIADVLKTVGVGEVAQLLGDLAQNFENSFSKEATLQILPSDFQFDTIVINGKKAVDTTSGPISQYFNILSEFKNKLSDFATRLFDDFLTNRFLGKDIDTQERISILQSFSMNPRYLTESSSKLMEALQNLQEDDFSGEENPLFPGFESIYQKYYAEYYEGTGKVKKKKQTDNVLALHRQLDDPYKPDFRDITEYTDADFNSSLLNKPRNVLITREDMEVYNGLDTCINYYISKFPDISFKDDCKIPLTFDDIAVGMGYSKLTENLRLQIGRSLAKFENLRCTNFWKDELKARGLLDRIDELVDMYGDVVSVQRVAPKLLSLDYVFITKTKSPKTSTSKNNQLVEFNGKQGIIITQFPPLTAYNLITEQIIHIPIEWVNIPKTGTSQELKRIKRYLCKRIQTLIHFQDLETNKGKYDKRNFNPNRDNYNKVILDDLLSEIGGYDLKIQESFPHMDVNGNILKDDSGNPLMRPATPEEIKKQKKSKATQRRNHINQILKYLEELKKIVPRIKEIKVETKDGRDYSLRIIIE